MTDNKGDSAFSRRNYVKLFGGTAGSIAIAGCTGGGGDGSSGDGSGDGSSGDGSGDGSSGDDGSGDDGSSDGGTTTLELQHWWTDGGGAIGMEELQSGFTEQYPDIEINDNPVAGGGGTNLQAVIRQKVLEGDPPSTWQDWPGANLQDYVDAGALKDIGYIFEGEMEENYGEGALLSARAGDEENPYVAVPLNIHRVNNVFWDMASVEEAGVDMTSIGDPREYVEVLEQLDSELDIAPLGLSMAVPWTILQLWNANLVGLHGVDAYEGFQNGDDVTSEVEEALEVTQTQMGFATEDASSVGSDAARLKLPQGEAVTLMEGDWAAGNLFAAEGYDYGDDWGHAPYPGTDGVYTINTDGFPYPKPNPTPDATDKWMEWVGSAEAQRRFCQPKGAIPCRTDVDMSEFSELLQNQAEDYQSGTGILTLAHGDGVTPQQGTSLKNAMARFRDQGNVQATAQSLMDAMTL